MNKHLLLGTALLVAISAFPQAGKLTKPSGVLPMTPKKLDFNESSTTNAATFSGPVKQINYVTKANNANKTSATIPSNIFTGSHNVFGYLVSQSRPLQYKKGINAVSMIARKSTTYTASSNSNSGTIVGHWSTNLGTTWDESCIWANGTNLARYPNGGIYNPSGNTNINNAYLVGSGPITTSGWTGDWYASKQITTPGNTTPGANQISEMDAAPTMKKHAFSRYSFNTIEGGLARSIASVLNDPNGTTYATIGYRGAAMVKGVFSAGMFTWSVDSFCPPVNTRPADGSRIIFGAPIQAWDDAGQTGYVVLFGSRGGELADATHASPKGGIQPIVYMTTTGGTSWSLLPAQDFADPVCFTAVYDRSDPIATNTNVIIANFQGSEGYDAVVDANGQLHIAAMVYGHNQSQLDSLGYRYVFGTEQWSYRENGPFGYPTIYDFYTRPSGLGWNYIMVDSMGTEGPSGTSGQPGYASNVWSDGSGAKMDQDARIQMSRSYDGKKIFYSWTETDTVILAIQKWNTYPDLNWKGFDINSNNMTPRMLATTSTDANSQLAYYHYMCDKAVGASSVCMTMPFTITRNPGVPDGSVAQDTYFLGDAVCPTAFSVTAMSPKLAGCTLGLTSENVFNFNVMNFPNPAERATTIVVDLKDVSKFEVVLYSSVGQLLNTYKINGQLGANEINVDLSSYSAGVYFYNVKVGNSVITKKLIVQ